MKKLVRKLTDYEKQVMEPVLIEYANARTELIRAEKYLNIALQLTAPFYRAGYTFDLETLSFYQDIPDDDQAIPIQRDAAIEAQSGVPVEGDVEV